MKGRETGKEEQRRMEGRGEESCREEQRVRERGRAEGRGGESKKLLPSGQVTPSQDLWEL